MADGLEHFLREAREGVVRDIPRGHYTPGYWTMLAATGRRAGIRFEDLRFGHEPNSGYAQALRLPTALGAADDYPYDRRNEGRNYSGLVLLESAETTDQASERVNGCVRHIFAAEGLDQFVHDLAEVVGDLHDNVWSHGKSTGFSMAQTWRNLRQTDSYWFEFSLADCGMGFLRETQRAGIPGIDSDADAISWCIKKGNTSKRTKVVDDMMQSLPPDMMGNPMFGFAAIKESDNHHMGLGLAKLMALVEKYRGRLWLASGASLLYKPPMNEHVIRAAPSKCKGVALAVRFDTSVIREILVQEAADSAQTTDETTANLITLLGG
ncbi:hypothetical protein AWB80_06893 [Caballeronia pedi]|uniref:Uncharacterized protein n=1 Tax=Caballeronia pedi TaxID=1777141 RepID=A0A158DI79_9BURK|nr:hypothetical protein [Caballeronia pedi]SAK93936.1 hypothetical protein AWB80_06893 [Caballeronia pedi]